MSDKLSQAQEKMLSQLKWAFQDVEDVGTFATAKALEKKGLAEVRSFGRAEGYKSPWWGVRRVK